ncbi:hypothetical protein B0T13DRAFT_447023 [Neurospora crassa]|nr:hypothetical protein B0T13DRAFT_447023 [Neurospora crassa]
MCGSTKYTRTNNRFAQLVLPLLVILLLLLLLLFLVRLCAPALFSLSEVLCASDLFNSALLTGLTIEVDLSQAVSTIWALVELVKAMEVSILDCAEALNFEQAKGDFILGTGVKVAEWTLIRHHERLEKGHISLVRSAGNIEQNTVLFALDFVVLHSNKAGAGQPTCRRPKVKSKSLEVWLTYRAAATMPNKHANVFQMGVQGNDTNDLREPPSLLSLTPQAEAGVDVDGTLAGPGLESDLVNVAGCRSGSEEEPNKRPRELARVRLPT